MPTIKATVRAGRIEVNEPIDLPDGTELTIAVPNGTANDQEADDDWDNSPEAIAKWIAWLESLDNQWITPEEEAAMEAWSRKCDEHEREKTERELGELFP